MPKKGGGLEEFFECFCSSLAEEFVKCFGARGDTTLPRKIVLYLGQSDVLGRVQQQMLASLEQSLPKETLPSWELLEEGAFPEVRKETYYVNVGYFLELYERKKACGKRVVF